MSTPNATARSHRRLDQERRFRVEGLHRVVDRGVDSSFLLSTGIDSGKAVPRREDCLPFTLDHYLRTEVERRRAGKLDVQEFLLSRAKDLAHQVEAHELNPFVLARFAVERVIEEQAASLAAFSCSVPNYFVGGKGFSVHEETPRGARTSSPDPWTAFSPRDLNALQANRPSMVKTTKSTITATWEPTDPSLMATADVVRAPYEALALAATGIRSFLGDTWAFEDSEDWTQDLGISSAAIPLLTIGLGYAAPAQALSAMLGSDFEVHSIRAPYVVQEPEPRAWQAMILSIPSAHEWNIAYQVGNTEDVTKHAWRSTLRDVGSRASTTHVRKLADLSIQYRIRGTVLVILASADTYHLVVGSLRERNLIEPLIVGSLDTSKRPTWVAYDNYPPWAPHGLPSPTGRLVSFWRWA